MPNIINKVVYNGQTLIDLTQDTVTANDVLQGVTVHLADGTSVTGTMIATSTPTADTISKWDSNAQMNSTDMTSQEVEDFVDDLNLTAIQAVDYIVEQGTSGSWKYRKWNSGRYELTIRTSDSFAITNALGQTYYGNKSYDISGLGILSFNNVQVTGEVSGVYFGTKIDGLTTSTLQLSARASASTTVTILHNIYIDGTWK